MSKVSPAERLRTILRTAKAERRPIQVVACGDPLSARLVEQAGYELNFLSGFCFAATQAIPDVEYLGFGETTQQIAAITRTSSIPLIADGDTGYGNEMTVKRTVKGFARAGAAGVMIEDQSSPKRCGHMAAKQIVSRQQALSRMRAVMDARQEEDIVVIGRTDGRIESFEECVARAIAFAELGCEIVFPEALATVDELRSFAQRLHAASPATILMVNCLEGGRTPMLSANEYAQLGFTLVAMPFSSLMASVSAMQAVLAKIKSSPDQPPEPALTFKQLQDVVGFTDYVDESKAYGLRTDDERP